MVPGDGSQFRGKWVVLATQSNPLRLRENSLTDDSQKLRAIRGIAAPVPA